MCDEQDFSDWGRKQGKETNCRKRPSGTGFRCVLVADGRHCADLSHASQRV